MDKIMLLDDDPKELVDNKQTLLEIITAIYADSEYELIIETDPDTALSMIQNDRDIKLVLLDTWFGPLHLGPELAERIAAKNSSIKIISLTSEEYGDGGMALVQKNNVWKYLVKKKLKDKKYHDRLFNLSDALIKDPDNKSWEFDIDFEENLITLNNTRFNECFQFLVPNRRQHRQLLSVVLEECEAAGLRSPMDLNEIPPGFFPFKNPTNDEYIATTAAEVAQMRSALINALNEQVQNKTNWRTWGILSNKGCKPGCVKLEVEPAEGKSSPKSKSDTIKSLQQELAKVKSRLEKIEHRLNLG